MSADPVQICGLRQRHPTRIGARAYKNVLLREGVIRPGELQVYKCGICLGFHLCRPAPKRRAHR